MNRRMQHTRQVLLQAFMEIAHEKGLMTASIQEITERADVNRGTFYLHFADKYALVDATVREDFRHFLTSILAPASRWDRRSLHLLIQTVLEYFGRKYRHHLFAHDVAPLIERAIREELAELLLTWLKQDGSVAIRGPVPLETMARLVSWTIFGAAVQWSQEATTVSSEQMAHDVLLVITQGVINGSDSFS
jgi:AcrR family transcriptional regulator